MLLFDALIFRCEGWTPDLGESELSAFHLTVGDPFSGFDRTCDEIAQWWSIMARDSDKLFPILDVADLDGLSNEARIGVMLGLQNGIALGESASRVELLWRLGVRVLQLTYNDANRLADGCAEPRDAGLTDVGRAVVRQCNRSGVVVDLSHVGEAASLEAAHLSQVPVVASHTNRRSIADNPRNKADSVLHAIADTGGVIGVSPWGPMCWKGEGERYPELEEFIEQVKSIVELLGEDAVAIGTDFHAMDEDGAHYLQANRERMVSRFPAITGRYVNAFGNAADNRYCRGFDNVRSWRSLPEVLAHEGFGDRVVSKLVAENWLRVCRQVWEARE